MKEQKPTTIFRKTVYRIVNKDTLQKFNEKYPNHPPLDYRSAISIMSKVNNMAGGDCMISNIGGIELPSRIGKVFIGRYKYRGRKAPYRKSHYKGGQSIWNMTMKTDGYICTILYSNFMTSYNIKFRNFWRFISCGALKKKISCSFAEDYQRYMIMDKKLEPLDLKSFKRREKAKNANLVAEWSMDDYNEFEL